ncbi:hypothetical protein JCM6882_004186 [Rhodosporidiobolus microsporus]
MAHPSSDIDELADDPALRPSSPSQRRRASAPAGRGRGKKAKEVWPSASRGARSSKPSLTKATGKGRGKTVVKRVRAAEEEEEDQLADDQGDDFQQQQQVQPHPVASTSAAKLERFRFNGPKPAPMQEGLPSSASTSSSSAAPLASKLKKRPHAKVDEHDEIQPPPAKRSTAKPQHQQQQKTRAEAPLFFFPDVDENGDPILEAFSSSHKPDEPTPSSTLPPQPAPSRPVSHASSPAAAKSALSSPFRPSRQPERSSGHSVNSLRPLVSPSQPVSPASRQPQQQQQQQPNSLKAKQQQQQPSSPRLPQSSFEADPSSSYSLPTQVRQRMNKNDELRGPSSPAPAFPSCKAAVPAASSGVQQQLPPRSSSSQRAPPSSSVAPKPAAPASSSRSSQPQPQPQSHSASHPARTQKPLTVQQQHEVDELLEGLLDDEVAVGALNEDWVETMVEVEEGVGAGSGGHAAEEAKSSTPEAAVAAHSPLVLSQLSSAGSHRDAGSRSSQELFVSKMAAAKEAPRFPSFSPIANEAGHPQAESSHPPSAAATSKGLTSAATESLPFASTSAHPLSTSTGATFAPPSGPAVSTSDPSSFLPLSIFRTPPKPRPQFRLVPLTVEGLTSHLRELVSSTSTAGEGEGGSDSTTAFLRREVERLTREVLSRDATISALSTSLSSSTAALDASREREKQWAEREKEWEQERERAERKVDAEGGEEGVVGAGGGGEGAEEGGGGEGGEVGEGGGAVGGGDGRDGIRAQRGAGRGWGRGWGGAA